MNPEARNKMLNAMTDKWADLASNAREIFTYIAGQDGDDTSMTKEELITAHGVNSPWRIPLSLPLYI